MLKAVCIFVKNFLYNRTKTEDYESFVRLLHPHAKISEACEEELRSFGYLRTKFLMACEKMTKFDRIAPSFEVSTWNTNELKKFEIILKHIDRIYCVSYNFHPRRIKIYARMQYKNRPVYAIICTFFSDRNKDEHARGYSFLCFNGNVFMSLYFFEFKFWEYDDNEKFFLADELNTHLLDLEMCKILNNSSIYFNNNPLSLSHFCYKSICQYEKRLESRFSDLPACIHSNVVVFNKIDQFVKTIEEYYAVCRFFRERCVSDTQLHWELYQLKILILQINPSAGTNHPSTKRQR